MRNIEKDIEKKLVQRVKSRGGIAPKWVSPGYAGVPDRLVFLPKGKFAMAELKAPGEVPRPLQKSRHRFFRKLGFKVYVIDGVDEIDEVLDEIEGKEKEDKEKQDGRERGNREETKGRNKREEKEEKTNERNRKKEVMPDEVHTT